MISSLRSKIEKRKEKQALLEADMEKLQLNIGEKAANKPETKEFKEEQTKAGLEARAVTVVTQQHKIQEQQVCVEAFGRFADEPEYRMEYARRGTALIINNKVSGRHGHCQSKF
jgi:hypothetical protein